MIGFFHQKSMFIFLYLLFRLFHTIRKRLKTEIFVKFQILFALFLIGSKYFNVYHHAKHCIHFCQGSSGDDHIGAVSYIFFSFRIFRMPGTKVATLNLLYTNNRIWQHTNKMSLKNQYKNHINHKVWLFMIF